MSTPAENLDAVRRYLKAIEGGTFADIAGLFTPDMTMEQFPNRIYPKGLRSGVAKMAEAFGAGRKLLSTQSYEIKNAVAAADSVAVEVLWTGTLAISFGALTAGSQMRAFSAMFFEFSEGKICKQRNYDCFDPW